MPKPRRQKRRVKKPKKKKNIVWRIPTQEELLELGMIQTIYPKKRGKKGK